MKDRYNLKILQVLNLFLNNPYDKFYLREVSRKLKISPNTANRFLNLFISKKWILDERQANVRYFKSNPDSQTFKHLKITHNIAKIEETGILTELKDKENNTIILFGSTAKGEDDKSSDIDLLCIGKERKINKSIFEKKLEKELNIHYFTIQNWEKNATKIKAFYQEVISTGINLLGYTPIVNL